LATPPATDPDPLPPPELVADERGLKELVRRLADHERSAVDTEADSFYHYQEKVCLLQVTAGDRDWLIDPLAKLDLGSFGEVLADPRREKIFHDGEYDVLILRREYGFRFRNLFDTRIAAAALGSDAPGLASVLQHYFGIELDKSQQRSDWSRRPLSPQQVAYARLDTRYLIPLAARMRAQLDERERLMIVEGECARLEEIEPPERVFNPDEFVRLKGARGLRPRSLRALRELFAWRDGAARARDVPPFKVLSHGALVAVARALPRNVRELERVDGLSPRLAKRIADDVLAVLAEANELGPLNRVPKAPPKAGEPRLDEIDGELHERLKQWRKGRAEGEGMDSSLVMNRVALRHLAQERPRDLAALRGTEGVLEWQVERYGGEILEVVELFLRDLAAGKVPAVPRRGRRR